MKKIDLIEHPFLMLLWAINLLIFCIFFMIIAMPFVALEQVCLMMAKAKRRFFA